MNTGILDSVTKTLEGSLPDESDERLRNGIVAFEANEFALAWQLLKPLSDAANAEAQYRCAIMIQNGLGVKPQPKIAAALMESAAEKQLGLAQHALGVMYLFGDCVEANPVEAVRWLECAGKSGLAGAWSTLGMRYREGQGVEKDIELARKYYRKAGFDADELG